MMHSESENTPPRINTPTGAHAPAKGLPGGIKVIGVGRCGCNAVEHLIKRGVTDVECIFVTADDGALTPALHDIAASISGAQLVFIVAGLGGGTGSVTAPLLANTARGMGIRTFGVVFTPFDFEGQKRNARAAASQRLLDESLTMMTVVPNDRLLVELGENASQEEAFAQANDVVRNAVRGMVDISAAMPCLMGREGFSHVWHTPGRSLVGCASAFGPFRVSIAMARALECPLVADRDLNKAKAVLIMLTATEKSLKLGDFLHARNMILERWPVNTTAVFETTCDNALGDEVRVTVMVAGLSSALASQT